MHELDLFYEPRKLVVSDLSSLLAHTPLSITPLTKSDFCVRSEALPTTGLGPRYVITRRTNYIYMKLAKPRTPHFYDNSPVRRDANRPQRPQ